MILNCKISHSDLFNRSFEGYIDVSWCNKDDKDSNIVQVAESLIKQIHYGVWEIEAKK